MALMALGREVPDATEDSVGLLVSIMRVFNPFTELFIFCIGLFHYMKLYKYAYKQTKLNCTHMSLLCQVRALVDTN